MVTQGLGLVMPSSMYRTIIPGSTGTSQQEDVVIGNLLQTEATCRTQLAQLNPCAPFTNHTKRSSSHSILSSYSTVSTDGILYDISDVSYNYDIQLSSAISYPTQHVYFLNPPTVARYDITTGKIGFLSNYCGTTVYSVAMGKNDTVYMVYKLTFPTSKTAAVGTNLCGSDGLYSSPIQMTVIQVLQWVPSFTITS